MSDPSGRDPTPDPPEPDDLRTKPTHEKVPSEKHKAELEKKSEKLEKEKHEKLEKPEFEKLAEKSLKRERGELKTVIEEKSELKDLKDRKEDKSEFDKPVEGFHKGPLPIDRDALLQHADALEQTARQLRHFIDEAERPDLRRGALQDEPDDQGRP